MDGFGIVLTISIILFARLGIRLLKEYLKNKKK
jgi:hypothetical protein